MNIFVPRKLMREKDIISEVHKQKDKRALDVSSSEEIKTLVTKIAGTSKRRVKPLIYSLTKREVMLVIGYLPQNRYQLKMDNLLQVYIERADAEGAKLLFSEWQNAYDNNELNAFLSMEGNIVKPLSKVLSDNHYAGNMFIEILKENNIPGWYGRYCMRQNSFNASVNTFSEKLRYLGVQDTSRLHKDILYSFYTYCFRRDYLSAGTQTLLEVTNLYLHDGSNLRLFIINFLEQLSLTDLRQFDKIAESLERITGPNETAKQKNFFKDYPLEIWTKYKDWLNQAHIFKYFGDDERSRFWSHYHFESVVHINNSNSVVLKTTNYYIVEFLGKAMGPMYCYEKEVYETRVRFWMPNNSNASLRSKLFENRDVAHRRLTHNGYWQGDFDAYLRWNRITNRL